MYNYDAHETHHPQQAYIDIDIIVSGAPIDASDNMHVFIA